MKNLIAQLLKFGVVGVLAAVIDIGIMNFLLAAFHMHNVIASTISFLISLAFNYLASMKYVFKHRDDMAKWMEILIFFVSAAVGLFMNEAIIWISTFGMNHDAMITQHAAYVLRTNIGKIVATGVVAVWNFIIRKWFLDDTNNHAFNELRTPGSRLSPEQLDTRRKQSFSHKLGRWSLTHTPKGWPK